MKVRSWMLTNRNSLQTNDQKATTLALLTVFFWSTVATAFKIGLRQLDPARLIFIASLTSTAILFVVLIFTGKLKRFHHVRLSSVLLSAFLGFLNPFLYYMIIFKAYSLLPAQVAQPLNMIWPIVLALLSVPLLKQKIEWKSMIALLISFLGVFLISTQGDFFSLKKSDPLGVALGLGSSLIWSLFWIFNVKNKEDEQIKLFMNFFFGTCYLLIYLPLFSSYKFKWDEGLYAGIYIGFFEIGISFILWMKALSLSSNNARIANFIYIAPFLSLIFIHFIIGEQIYITTILGIFFIISGILFQQNHKNPK